MTSAEEKITVDHHEEEGVDLKAQHESVYDILPDWGRPWYKTPHLLHLNLILFFTFLSGIYNGYDNSLLNGLQSMPEWETYFGSPAGAKLGATSNGMLYGNLLALPFTSFFCDRLGRVRTLLIGASVVIIGVIIQTASQNFAMYTVGRFILGFGVLLSTTASPLLIAEVTYPTHRPYVTACSQALYGLGGIIASWTTYGTSNWSNGSSWMWRTPLIIQMLFPLLQLSALYWIPESPRWHVSRGNIAKAREFLLKYHAGGDEAKGGQLVEYELAEITYAIEMDKQREGIQWFDFFRTKANLHRLFIIVYLPVLTQLSGNAVLSYFLHIVLDNAGITSSHQQLIFNGCLSVFNFVIGLVSLTTIEKVGRRRMFLIGSFFNMINYTIFTILSARNAQEDFKNQSLSKGVIAMIFIFYLFFVMAYLAIPTTYMTEVVPFHLRAKGYVIHTFFLTGVLLFNGFVSPIAMGAISWKYYILYCCLNLVNFIVIYLFFPETKRLSLEEVNRVFGEDVLTDAHIIEEVEQAHNGRA
ncbi:galactose permease GAL2 [Sugiyamaella lignohabitans]|uniref:Galactose permease GAL2 n=1 Tax=Sugiyamaella lignohabitans TaxID=796027 RepID=A0A167DA40_9ASCO|nr:galactose permease GAL2 [Sugiyamaella lignohabitans]ANB12665.1 galactose permease GAL2 [Sugiyamaella lignohabitans]